MGGSQNFSVSWDGMVAEIRSPCFPKFALLFISSLERLQDFLVKYSLNAMSFRRLRNHPEAGEVLQPQVLLGAAKMCTLFTSQGLPVLLKVIAIKVLVKSHVP